MRVAFVYDAVYPWEKGGAQKRVWELARRLADDHDVHIYGMHYWEGPATMAREGVTFHGVCEPYELYTDGRRSIPQAIKFTAQLTPQLLREDFDIVDCQQFPYFPIFVAKAHEHLWQSNLIVTWYEVWDDYWEDYLGTKGIFGKAIERLTASLPQTIVPISLSIQDDLRAIGRTHGLHVVENGVDAHGQQDLPAAETQWDVIYVGRLAEHKNVSWLLDAVATASEQLGRHVTTCIIGDGPERKALEQHADEVGVADRVTFQGFVEADEDVIGHMKAASVFVLPSTREGFPNTILEANACGVPSIVIDHSENGSTAVVEEGETGFIVDPDPDAIAARIVDMLEDDDLLATLSASARTYGEGHDWDNIVADLEEVYSNVHSTHK